MLLFPNVLYVSCLVYILYHHVSPAFGLSLRKPPSSQQQFWKRAFVDYSAANEYISVHYGMDNYFATQSAEVGIRNARDGVYNFEKQAFLPPKLSNCGFEIISKGHYDQFSRRDDFAERMGIDWNDPNDVTKKYISGYLREVVIPSCLDDDEEILCCAFWNPTLRGEELPMTTRELMANVTKTAPVAETVHIDMDVNACTNSSELVHFLLNDKNRVHEEVNHNYPGFDANQFIEYIDLGHRFLLLNFWQSIGEEPVQSAPLGLLSVKYQSTASEAFPDAIPHPDKSNWYSFPEMTNEECLVFKQYDRDVSYASDIWHCGLSSIVPKNAAPKRRNFDVRAFVILKEQVQETTNDRFAPSRRKSKLTRDESECFCTEQAKRREAQT